MMHPSMNNDCPVCGGDGKLVAFGAVPVVVPCPECAGLAIVPASADDELAVVELAPGKWVAASVPSGDTERYDDAA